MKSSIGAFRCNMRSLRCVRSSVNVAVVQRIFPSRRSRGVKSHQHISQYVRITHIQHKPIHTQRRHRIVNKDEKWSESHILCVYVPHAGCYFPELQFICISFHCVSFDWSHWIVTLCAFLLCLIPIFLQSAKPKFIVAEWSSSKASVNK